MDSTTEMPPPDFDAAVRARPVAGPTSVPDLGAELRSRQARAVTEDWAQRGTRLIDHVTQLCHGAAEIPGAPNYVVLTAMQLGPDYRPGDADRLVAHFTNRKCKVQWAQTGWDSDGDPAGEYTLTIQWGTQ